MHTPFLQSDAAAHAAAGAQASPALLPAPAQGTLYTVAGGDESAEFLRQNPCIQEAWGERARAGVRAAAGAATTSACWMRWWSRAPAAQLALDLLRDP
jgi:arylformamidase